MHSILKLGILPKSVLLELLRGVILEGDIVKMKRIAIIITLFFASLVTSAQEYQIRTNHNTNLREGNSLTAGVVVTVSSGTVLHVVGNVNRWLQINRNGNTVWMAEWVGHTRVAASSETAPQVDNCCFVDRECNTDHEWTSGYWAFQNGQCAAPAQTQQQTTVQPATAQPSQVDNCCFVDRQCNTDHEWTAGYWAYQNNQCGAPGQSQQSTSPAAVHVASDVDNCCFLDWFCDSDDDWLRGFYARQSGQCLYGGVKVDGSQNFITLVDRAFDLLKRHAPNWREYVVAKLHAIKQIPKGEGSGILIDTRTFVESVYGHVPPDDYAVVSMVGRMVHEACHVHQWDEGVATEGWRNEIRCVREQLAASEAVDPLNRQSPWLRNLIANIENPEYWWWTD